MAEQVKMTIIVDNNSSGDLGAEHGYALLIETGVQTILFDTGDRGVLVENFRLLGLDMSSITDLILSHGHYDHTGGVDSVVEAAPGVQVYLHRAAPVTPRYSSKDGGCRAAHIPSHSLQSLDQLAPDQLHWLHGPLEILPGLGLTGEIPRNTGYEDTGGVFSFDQQGEQTDPIQDDMALWMKSPDGLLVFVGCSHSGIVNTLETIMDITGERSIHTVIGGLHLKNAGVERFEQTAQALNNMDIYQLIGCHCTGDKAFDYLEQHLDCKVVKGFAGLSLTV